MKFAVTIPSMEGYRHTECFREIAQTIDYGLKALGHDSLVTDDGNIPGRRHIVLGPNLLALMPFDIEDDAILYNLEQIRDNNRWVSDGLVDLYRRYRIWDYSDDNIAALAAHKVRVAHRLPVSFAPILDRIGPSDETDIDVLFIGSTNDRRQSVVDAMRERGLTVLTLFNSYGAERDAIIGRAKVMLNVHFYPAKVFEIVRCSYYLANRRTVLSERSANPAEDAEFEGGIAFCNYDQLADRAVELCRSADERQSLAERGFEIFASQRIETALAPALASLGA